MKKRNKNSKKNSTKKRKPIRLRFSLPGETKKYILGVVSLLLAIIFVLSFFEKAGIAGKALFQSFVFLVGKAVFAIPLILVISGLVFFFTRYQKFLGGVILAALFLTLGISGIFGAENGGWLGKIITLPLLKLFGAWVAQIILGGIIIIGGVIFWHLLKQPRPEAKEEKPTLAKAPAAKPSLIKRIFGPRFKVKEVEPTPFFGREGKQ